MNGQVVKIKGENQLKTVVEIEVISDDFILYLNDETSYSINQVEFLSDFDLHFIEFCNSLSSEDKKSELFECMKVVLKSDIKHFSEKLAAMMEEAAIMEEMEMKKNKPPAKVKTTFSTKIINFWKSIW
jgi:hypothetical protein